MRQSLYTFLLNSCVSNSSGNGVQSEDHEAQKYRPSLGINLSYSNSITFLDTAESLKPTKKIKQISKSAKGTGNVEKSTLSKKILKATSSSTSAAPKRPRKRTADLLEDDHTSEVTSSKPTNTSTSSKRAKKDGEVMAVTKSGKKTFKEGEEVAITEANHEDSADSDNGLNEDQTAALLAGFESSDEDGDSDEGEANGPEPEGLSLQQLPDIPDEGKEQNQNKAKSGKVGEGPGVIYIGLTIPRSSYPRHYVC